MTIYTLNSRLRILERKIHDLYCYIKNNSLGGNKDIEFIDSSNGIILTSPNGSKFKITINDSGDLQINLLETEIT